MTETTSSTSTCKCCLNPFGDLGDAPSANQSANPSAADLQDFMEQLQLPVGETPAAGKMMCFLDKKGLTNSAYLSPGGEYAILATGLRVDGIVLIAVTAPVTPQDTPYYSSAQIQMFDSLDSCETETSPPDIFIWTNGNGKVLRTSRPQIEGEKAYVVMKLLENGADTFTYNRFTFDLVPKW